MPLTTKQKSYLRGLAQPLKPTVHLGHEGLTENTLRSLEDQFRTRELVKVRALPTAGVEAKEAAELLGAEAKAEVVGVIGHTFVLYRPNSKLKERIKLTDMPAGQAEPPAERKSAPRPASTGAPRRAPRPESRGNGPSPAAARGDGAASARPSSRRPRPTEGSATARGASEGRARPPSHPSRADHPSAPTRPAGRGRAGGGTPRPARPHGGRGSSRGRRRD